MAKEETSRKRKIVTPPFRVSFPCVFEKRGFEGSEPKFSITAVFDVNSFGSKERNAFKAMQVIAEAAAQEKFHASYKSKGLRGPFRDGAEKEHLEGFGPGLIFCTLSTKMRPGLINREMQPILEEEEFYAGCYARATITAYAYSNVSKGVAFGLHNVQKLGEGENLTGRSAPEDDFEGEAPAWGDIDAVGSGQEPQEADPLLD